MSQRVKVATKRRPHAAVGAADCRRFVAPAGLAFVLLATFFVYRPALEGTLLWDDNGHITKPELQSAGGLYRIWFELGATQQYYPLLHSAFWIEHKLWGDATLGYHLVNLLWHMVSVVLLYLILTRLKIPGALLAAAIFAVHPVMVESVAWISEQKNTLSGVFYLIAMLVYLKFDESRPAASTTIEASKRAGPSSAPSAQRLCVLLYFLSLGLFTLGLLTKTVIATLPAALLVIFWWQRGTLSWKRDVLPLVPFFVLGAVGGLTTAWVERTLIGAEGADFELSLVQRGLVAGRVIWFYLGKLVWPANLMFIYRHWTIDPAQWWHWVFPIAALGVTVGLWLNRKRWRGALTGWLLLVGTLFPALGFLNVFPFVFSFVADHFQYLASLGIIVVAAAGIAQIIAGLGGAARFVGVAMCVLGLGTLAVLASRQSAMYADAVTLYQTTVDRNPECWMALDNLGEELAAKGQMNEAIELYRAALRIRPNFAQAENSLGYALTQIGRPSEGVEHIEQAIRLRPDFSDANLNLSKALRQVGRKEEAVEAARRFLRGRPDSADARNNLANTLVQAGHVPEGIAEFRAALAQKPDDPLLLNNFGLALMASGEASEAVELLQRAVEIRPDYYQARNSLGLALAKTGKAPQAIAQFESALALNPNYANAHCNLADALIGTGDVKNAITHYRRATEIRPEFAEAQYKLAVSLTQSGQPEPAIAHYQAAIRVSPKDLQPYASLAQTLALLHRSQEAIETAEKGIELARAAKQADELQQFETWLKDYRAQLKQAAASSSSPPAEQSK